MYLYICNHPKKDQTVYYLTILVVFSMSIFLEVTIYIHCKKDQHLTVLIFLVRFLKATTLVAWPEDGLSPQDHDT